ncbi:MAG: UDPGP type 1 family protein, partial [Butyrivibrio sp.]|nr:UDPGP type 1 family protein [Butyrivibrio sp.]
MTFEEAKAKLEKFDQLHVLKYYDELSDAEKAELIAQIEDTDFSVVENCKNLGKSAGRGEFAPLAAMQVSEIEKRRDELFAIGKKALKEGKIAACLLAGGMGTRLGSDNPKGMYNIGLTKDVYIFQRIIENLKDTVDQSDGTYIRLFI